MFFFCSHAPSKGGMTNITILSYRPQLYTVLTILHTCLPTQISPPISSSPQSGHAAPLPTHPSPLSHVDERGLTMTLVVPVKNRTKPLLHPPTTFLFHLQLPDLAAAHSLSHLQLQLLPQRCHPHNQTTTQGSASRLSRRSHPHHRWRSNRRLGQRQQVYYRRRGDRG